MQNIKIKPKIAYFSMEYGLDSKFKIYAGGLGILAGDYLKGAHEFDCPIVGIGIKWKQGYTDQKIAKGGHIYNEFHNYEYDFLKDTGIKIKVPIKSAEVVCRVWLAETFNNAPLYLLDTDMPENDNPWISGQLYGWFEEERLAQEIVLGIGGVRALRALEINPDIYHFNEGHAVFAGLELINEKILKGMTFNEALKASKAEIVFTTHTPVPQGNESHDINRIIYMSANNNLSKEQLVKIGGDPFNMTVAGLKLSKISNAVSKLHCKTANIMWKNIDEKPEIIGITNGIHLSTWIDENMIKAANLNTGIWDQHMKNKNQLIEFIKTKTKIELNSENMLIGFSRRAATYKRSDLIFFDESIIDSILKAKKIQMVFSGKSHPLDDQGKKIIEKLIQMANRYPESIVFLENYDMEIGRMLTMGSDVWLNNPRRPSEASGTSGMKAAINGVLNLSILDGWWDEICCHGQNGWQFGDGFESLNEVEADIHDSLCLYRVLLEEVIPTYYNDNNRWVKMMRNSILDTKDTFSVKRMLEEYYEKMYCI